MIEAAHCPDGFLVDEYISSLERSRRRKDRNALAVIALIFEEYARTGELEFPRELNNLHDGIREIKAGVHRFPFFHLPAETHTDSSVRLTHGFLKQGPQAPREHIDRAKWVRREDPKWLRRKDPTS